MVRHELSRQDARRIAVRAQWLHADRPAAIVPLVRQITLLQLDPTASIAPSVDLVLWSRLGYGYEPTHLVAALTRRELVEFRGTLRPAEDLALYRAEMKQWPGPEPLHDWQRRIRDWVVANDSCRRDILRRLESGPLTSRELPDTCAVPWQSSGWTNDRNVTQLLEFMVGRGEVAVSGRSGKERLWDLADRVYPPVPTVSVDEAKQRRNERRLAALGIARAKGPDTPVEPVDVGETGDEAVVDGVKGTWRVDPALVGQPFDGRTALLSPFDRLHNDRRRMTELFEFEYGIEMFKPAASRKWGYYALPILHNDRLVGKLDAAADRAAGLLRIAAIHWDAEPDSALTQAVDDEILGLANWLELDIEQPDD